MKRPFLTKDDVLRIRATVDADYYRDVNKLTDETTDDLGPIQVQPPAWGTETRATEPP
ncbi:hypothetical protein ACFVTM_18725 [Arthrobacter sp. NPDC058130]|uniref:hypothetical protein n=1 Tax=Arthrobacter sp. NPDC058130 TaxID=3346353 RepID=UPI0036ED3246